MSGDYRSVMRQKMFFPQFARYANLKYGFSMRNDGSMHRRTKKHNRERYFHKIGIDPNRVVTADLHHDSKVVKVSGREAGMMITDTDGLITGTKNLFLSATAADCFLLYFYDPIKNVVGISHAGWRGLLGGVVENSVHGLIKSFSVIPSDLLVGISPGIHECHFEVSASDKDKFNEYENYIFEKGGKVFVSLSDIIKSKLQNAGITSEHIEDSGLCTHCNDKKYFSYRRDHPKEVEVMVGSIGLI